MKKIILTPIIALLLGLTGCSTQQVKPIPYNQKALNLKVGMTKDEVINLLGTPKKVSAIKTNEPYRVCRRLFYLMYGSFPMIHETVLHDYQSHNQMQGTQQDDHH